MPKPAVNEISHGVFQLGHGPNSVIITIRDNRLIFGRQPAKLRQEGANAKNLVLEIEGSVSASEHDPSSGGIGGSIISQTPLSNDELEELFDEH